MFKSVWNSQACFRVAVEFFDQALCGDGVCADSEVQVFNQAATESTCVQDCPYIARSCPYPGSLAVSDPLQVSHCLAMCLLH